MTGDDVKRIREKLDFSQGQFAQVLGVSPSTLYRWEGLGVGDTEAEGLPRNVLEVLIPLVDRLSPEAALRLADRVRLGLIAKGSLFGFYELLKPLYEIYWKKSEG